MKAEDRILFSNRQMNLTLRLISLMKFSKSKRREILIQKLIQRSKETNQNTLLPTLSDSYIFYSIHQMLYYKTKASVIILMIYSRCQQND